MRFPAVGDVHHFIEKALYFREPNVSSDLDIRTTVENVLIKFRHCHQLSIVLQQHPRPPDYFYQGNKIQGDASPQIQRKATADVPGKSLLIGRFVFNFIMSH
jgi:hypothetical protein